MSQTSHLSLPEFKELVKDRVDLGEIVARNTKLEKSPQGFKACCPLPGHQEKTASFHVNTRDNYYYCYGCNRGGDVFSYLELVEGLSFIDALKELADSLQLEFPTQKGLRKQQGGDDYRVKKERALKLLERTSLFYQRALSSAKDSHAQEVLRYLDQRGISREERELYALGWTPYQLENALHRKISQDKALLEIALELGLVRRGAKGVYDFFIRRMMIPIQDVRGRVVAFSGRSLEEVTDRNPKYKNSSESFLFKKKEVLYGFYQAQKLIRENDFVCVVEGFFDQWAFQRRGIPSVAVMGTALTEDHLRFIGRHTKQIVMVLDNDAAGIRSTLRSLPMLFENSFEVKVFRNESGKDPDEWLSGRSLDTKGLKKTLLESPEALMWWGDLVLREAQEKSFNKLQKIERLKELWTYARTEAHRTLFLLEFAPSFSLSTEELRRSLSNSQAESRGSSREPGSPLQEATARRVRRPVGAPLGVLDRFALDTLKYWLKNLDALLPKSHSEWEQRESLFRGTLVEDFVMKLSAECYREQGELSASFVKNYLNMQSGDLPPELEKLLLQSIVKEDGAEIQDSFDETQFQKGFLEYARQLNREQKKREIAILQKKLREISSDQEKTAQVLQEIHRLRLSLEKEGN